MGFKQTTMVLYSDPDSINGHRVRIALAEKGMSVNVDYIRHGSPLPSVITSAVDEAELPVLVDRDLVLYDTGIIAEYLDERFPHPPLLPVNPIQRARYRLMMREIDQQWLRLADKILHDSDELARENARKELAVSLTSGANIFGQNRYLIGDEFSLVDCCLLPMLWRLNILGVELPAASTKPLRNYMDRMFDRKAFRESLSEEERDFEIRV